MKKVTAKNYKKERLYPRVVAAVSKILAETDVVTPIEVFVRLDLLRPSMVEDWRFHRIPCLEKAIQCNLSKACRILRLLRLHASASGLKPSQTAYMKWGKGARFRLRFSKFGDPNIETAYSTHYLKPHMAKSKQGTKERIPDPAIQTRQAKREHERAERIEVQDDLRNFDDEEIPF